MENLVTEKKRRNVYTKYKHIKKLAPLSCACSFSFIWNWNQDKTRQIKFRFCFLCHVFEHKKWNEILAQISERNPFTQIVLTFIHAKTKTVKQNWGWHRDLKLERLIIVANLTNTWRTQLFCTMWWKNVKWSCLPCGKLIDAVRAERLTQVLDPLKTNYL